MKHRLVLQHELPYDRDHVLRWLQNYAEFAQFHPLMEKVDIIDGTHFITHESMPLFWGLRWRFRYEVFVSYREGAAAVVYRARPFGMQMEFSFILRSEPASAVTEVLETVQLEGLFFAIFPTARKIKDAHGELFKRCAQARPVSSLA